MRRIQRQNITKREYQERELKSEIKKQEDYKDMFEDLKEIICEYVDVAPETIKEDSRFIEDLGFNSYDFMSMVGEIEEKFDVEVEEREVVNVKTVKDAVDYIQSLQAE
jgi:acyl carrier protein